MLTEAYDCQCNRNIKALGTNALNVKSAIQRAGLLLSDKLSDDFPMDGEYNLHLCYMDLHPYK